MKKLSTERFSIMKNLTQGNIYKNFILFAFPMVLAGILSQSYHIIDTVIAGKFLGNTGLAAIGSTSAFISFLSSIFWGYGTGFALYLGRLFAAKEYQKLKDVFYTNFLAYSLIMILFSLLCVFCQPFLFRFLQVDPAIQEEASVYFTVYMLGFFIILLNINGTYLLNALGISTYTLYMSILSTVLNISGNLLCVAVLKTGIVGLATSTVFSALVVTICYYLKLRQCFAKMKVADTGVRISFSSLNESYSYSVPTTLQQVIMYLAGFLISPLINGLGSAASSAYSVVMQVYNFNAAIYQNSTKTVGSYTTHCVGCGKYRLLKKGVYVGFLQGLLFVLPFLIACILFADRICAMFYPNGYQGPDLTYAIIFARFYLPLILFNVMNNLFHAFCRGIAAKNLLVASTVIGTGTRILATYLFVYFFGMQGVFIGWAFSWFAEAVFCIISFFSRRWEKKLPCNS